MSAAITPEQRQALAAAKENCLRLTDPENKEDYVLIKAEIYDRFQSLFADETIYTTADVLDRVMADDDANDPQLADWQKRYGGRLG